MKLKSLLCTVSLIVIGLSSTASAHDQACSSSRSCHGSAQAADNSPVAWRVARYPFRVTYTLIRTPLIFGETLVGRRSFVSSGGLFQAHEEPASDRPVRRTVWAS